MRCLFAGSPELSVPSLELLNAENMVCGVLTNPDKKSGRGSKIVSTPVCCKTRELNLPLLQQEKLNEATRAAVNDLRPDMLVVVAYSKIFGPKFLSLFPQGAINLHPSLLPKYRGPAPIPAAILAGESETGITVQRLALEMDSGDILRQVSLALKGDETTASLSDRVAEQGARLLREVLVGLDSISSKPQDHGQASYCRLIQKTDGLINWQVDVNRIERMIRAYQPWPTTYTYYDGKMLTLLRACVYRGPSGAPEVPGKVLGVDKAEGILVQTSHGILAVQELKLQSKKALHWKAFLNGAKSFVGSTLGESE